MMIGLFNGVVFRLVNEPVIWATYTEIERQISESDRGFDVGLATAQQRHMAAVGGGYRSGADVRPLYVSRLGFPQGWFRASRLGQEESYLVRLAALAHRPIMPHNTSEMLAYAWLKMPMVDTSADWLEKLPFPLLDEVPINDKQISVLKELTILVDGRLEVDGIVPWLTALWRHHDEIRHSLAKLGVVVEA